MTRRVLTTAHLPPLPTSNNQEVQDQNPNQIPRRLQPLVNREVICRRGELAGRVVVSADDGRRVLKGRGLEDLARVNEGGHKGSDAHELDRERPIPGVEVHRHEALAVTVPDELAQNSRGLLGKRDRRRLDRVPGEFYVHEADSRERR